eukprot:805770-Pyramimonas_sp.AAC.1
MSEDAALAWLRENGPAATPGDPGAAPEQDPGYAPEQDPGYAPEQDPRYAPGDPGEDPGDPGEDGAEYSCEQSDQPVWYPRVEPYSPTSAAYTTISE